MNSDKLSKLIASKLPHDEINSMPFVIRTEKGRPLVCWFNYYLNFSVVGIYANVTKIFVLDGDKLTDHAAENKDIFLAVGVKRKKDLVKISEEEYMRDFCDTYEKMKASEEEYIRTFCDTFKDADPNDNKSIIFCCEPLQLEPVYDFVISETEKNL